jgi:hypothetical protein
MTPHGSFARVLWVALLFGGSYASWLFVFERWLDPLLRLGLGGVLRCRVSWVHSFGAVRCWGVLERSRVGLDELVAFLGAAAVLFASLVPMVAQALLGYACGNDGALAATHCLLSVAMLVFFVLHVLRDRPETHA